LKYALVIWPVIVATRWLSSPGSPNRSTVVLWSRGTSGISWPPLLPFPLPFVCGQPITLIAISNAIVAAPILVKIPVDFMIYSPFVGLWSRPRRRIRDVVVSPLRGLSGRLCFRMKLVWLRSWGGGGGGGVNVTVGDRSRCLSFVTVFLSCPKRERA